MIHRMLHYPAGWEWHVVQQAISQPLVLQPLPSRKSLAKLNDTATSRQKLQQTDDSEERAQLEEQTLALKRQFPECAPWIDECAGRLTNHISVDEIAGIGPLLCGTLMIQVSEDLSDIQPFHFWLTRKRLITIHSDLRIPLRLQSPAQVVRYEECQMAPEAFFLMISVILETFHTGLDGFEQRLGDLEHTMRHKNRTGLLDVIFERRYELLHWSHLFLPIRELYGAAKESFMTDLLDTDSFIRMTHKLERIETLLKHYSLEIDTLISLDDAISSFRGNDIMKTLTIFTVLFLPATLAGTLMGSNFNRLPFRDHPWGFVAMIAAVAAITFFIYIWLWKKGWTGDLLNRRRQKSIMKIESSLQQSHQHLHHPSKRKRNKKNTRNDSNNTITTPDHPISRSRKNRL